MVYEDNQTISIIENNGKYRPLLSRRNNSNILESEVIYEYKCGRRNVAWGIFNVAEEFAKSHNNGETPKLSDLNKKVSEMETIL